MLNERKKILVLASQSNKQANKEQKQPSNQRKAFGKWSIPKNNEAVSEEEKRSIGCKDQLLQKWNCTNCHC